jgi:hypothetical protein
MSISAVRGIIVLFLALAIASLLDARGLRKRAETQSPGVQRTWALRLTAPLLAVSRATHLAAPRSALQAAIGRRGEDSIDSTVRLSLPPPATSHPRDPAAQAPRHARPRPAFTAAHPLRVWVAGDSLAQVPGDGLDRVAPANVQILGIESRLSTGLARPDLYNWFNRLATVMRSERPDVAVLSFGADDAHDYLAGVPPRVHVGRFGSPSWIAEYRRRVDGVTRELNAAGIRTIWLGLPITDGPGFRSSFAVVNRILATVAGKHPGSTYLDTWHLLDGAHGKYTPYLRRQGKLTLMRLPDGVHYTAAAGDLIAGAVLSELRAHYRLR